MRRLWCLQLNVQLRRRSECCIRESMPPKFRHGQDSGFIQTGGRNADRMFDAFRIGERDDAAAIRHASSIGEQKKNTPRLQLPRGIIFQVISEGYTIHYILGLVVLIGL
jgi:hypothetical protein